MYTIKQEDLDNNPLLVYLGYQVGDEIEDKAAGSSRAEGDPSQPGSGPGYPPPPHP